MILSAFSEIKKKKQTTKQTKKPHKDKQQRQQPHPENLEIQRTVHYCRSKLFQALSPQ